jgi:hypothetical protein
MNSHAATSIDAVPGPSGGTSKRVFARHFAEMVLVMFIGMGVFAGLAALAFGAADASLTGQSPALRVTLMGLSMTLPMVAWMRYRGHAAARNAEMAAAMMLPTLAAAALAAVDVLSAGAALGIQHAVMIPAMLGVMLWRYDEYATHS